VASGIAGGYHGNPPRKSQLEEIFWLQTERKLSDD